MRDAVVFISATFISLYLSIRNNDKCQINYLNETVNFFILMYSSSKRKLLQTKRIIAVSLTSAVVRGKYNLTSGSASTQRLHKEVDSSRPAGHLSSVPLASSPCSLWRRLCCYLCVHLVFLLPPHVATVAAPEAKPGVFGGVPIIDEKGKCTQVTIRQLLYLCMSYNCWVISVLRSLSL